VHQCREPLVDISHCSRSKDGDKFCCDHLKQHTWWLLGAYMQLVCWYAGCWLLETFETAALLLLPSQSMALPHTCTPVAAFPHTVQLCLLGRLLLRAARGCWCASQLRCLQGRYNRQWCMCVRCWPQGMAS
jgi:hypothetical protein